MSFVLSPASLAKASSSTRLGLVVAKQDFPCAVLGLLGLAHRLSCCSSSLESSERVLVEHLRASSSRGSGFKSDISCWKGLQQDAVGLAVQHA